MYVWFYYMYNWTTYDAIYHLLLIGEDWNFK